MSIRKFRKCIGKDKGTTHYTVEQEAVSELCEDFLSDKWDQKVVAMVQTLKSKFSQWFKKEKMAADKAQKSSLQIVGEESKEVEDETEIVDTVVFVESELLNEVGYGAAEIDSFAIMKDPRLDDLKRTSKRIKMMWKIFRLG